MLSPCVALTRLLRTAVAPSVLRRSVADVRMRDVIPDDAHLRCNNRVFISITTVSLAGVIQSEVISEFHSKDGGSQQHAGPRPFCYYT